MQNRFFLQCYLGLSFGIASVATGQQYDFIEVIPQGSYVVIEDRLIDERPLGDGILQGNIIENVTPLASERIESKDSVNTVHADAKPQASTTSASNIPNQDRYGEMIHKMEQRSAKLEGDLAELKELFKKHLATSADQQSLVAAKLAEAIQERDDARTQFEASLKEYAIRNEQVTTLAVGLREAYDRLEAKRAESGEVAEKSVKVIDVLRKQLEAVEAETKKAGQGLKSVAADAQKQKEVADRVAGVAGHLQSIQSEAGETAQSVEKLKKMVSALEDRIKELEKSRGKAKSKKDD